MLILSIRNIVGVLVLAVVVISAQIKDSDGRTNVINIGAESGSDDDVIYEADFSLQARDKRTIGSILSGVADLFGYDVQRRPSLLDAAPAAPFVAAPAVNGDPVLARQMAPAGPAPPGPAPAAPAPAAGGGPITAPVTLTDGVRRAFQLGVNWSNQRQQIGGPPPAPAGPPPAAPPAAAAAPPPPAAAAPPPPPPPQGERRSYTVGLNWQNLRQQLGGPPPGPAPAAPPPAGGAPPPAPAAAGPPPPQGFRQSYQVGLDFSNQRQQLGGPPPAPPAPAAAPPPAAAAPPPPAVGAPIANLGVPPRRVPELLRQNPLTPTLVQKIYFNKGAAPSIQKVYYPKEVDFETALTDRGYTLTTVASIPFNEDEDDDPPSVHLDTPPGERNEPSYRQIDKDEEELQEENEDEDKRDPEENDNDEKVERKEAPRGFKVAPASREWRKEKTGDPNEQVYVLDDEYTYGDKPKKFQIDLPDYSAETYEEKRNIPQTFKPRKFKKFNSVAPEYLRPTPSLLQKLSEDIPEEIKQFDSEFRHHRSVRSIKSPTTIHQQDTIPSSTLTRAYIIQHDSEPAENIEAARIINRKIINYYDKKFLNDAIAAQRAIQNPHLINEPHYIIDSDKYQAPYSVSFKQEEVPAIEKEKVEAVTIATPVQKVESIVIRQENDHGDVYGQHQNILKDLANNFNNQQRISTNKYPSASGIDKRKKVKEYHSKALDGIVKNFEKTARHELLGEKMLVDHHNQMIAALHEIAKQKERARQANEDEEEARDEQVEEKEKTGRQQEAKEKKVDIRLEVPNEEQPDENFEEDAEKTEEQDDAKVKVGNEDVVGPHEEFENAKEEKLEVKQEKEKVEQEKEAEAPQTEIKNEGEKAFDFFKPSDFVKDLEKIIYPKPHEKEPYNKATDERAEKGEDEENVTAELDEQEEPVKEQEENKESEEEQEDEAEEAGKQLEEFEYVKVLEMKKEKPKEQQEKEDTGPQTEIKKEDKEVFDFFKPSDFVTELENIIYPKPDESLRKEPEKNVETVEERKENKERNEEQEDETEESENDDEEEKDDNQKVLPEEKEDESENLGSDQNEDIEDDEESEEKSESEANEQPKAAVEAKKEPKEKEEQSEEQEKLRAEEEKRKKVEENEKELKAYINEHFEVDLINGLPVPKGVKDTERYKNIVENVRKPIEDFDFFSPNDFEYKGGFFGQGFDDNLKKLEKAGNKVEETENKNEEDEEDEESLEEETEEPDKVEDETKAMKSEDEPCQSPESKEKDPEENNEEDVEDDDETKEETKNDNEKKEKEEAELKPQSKQTRSETLSYPHEHKTEDIYSQFREEKLANPETQDSNKFEVVQPLLHTGTFAPGGVEALDNPEKVSSVPYDYDYSGSEKKVVLEISPTTEDVLTRFRRSIAGIFEGQVGGKASKVVKRDVQEIKWYYKPDRYDPSLKDFIFPEPKAEDLSYLEIKNDNEDEPLSPKAIITESESGRKKTYIRVNKKEQEMYG